MKKILTRREKEVFDLLVSNYDTKEISEQLNISEKTVRNHISNVILKLAVKGRAQAVVEPVSYTHLDVYKRQVEDRVDALKGKEEESEEASDSPDGERGRAGMCKK